MPSEHKTNETIKYKLATAMKECMKSASVEKITVTEIVETCGVTRQTLSKYETGESLPDIERCKRLADIFGVSMDDLVNYEKTDRENLGLEVPPKGKHVFGMVKVGDKGQIVIPANARKIFDIQPGDNLLILGDEEQGIAILKEKSFLEHLRLMERMRHMESGE